jgi:tetratricopeptide (TPR) repeat protein
MGGRSGEPSQGNEFSGNSQGPVVQSGRIDHVHFHAPSSPLSVTPRQLPPITALFTGRDEDYGWLDRQWSEVRTNQSGALFVISGTAGVGKTSLAIAWLRAHAADFPDGQLYADLGGYSQQPRSPEDVVGEFLRALGVAAEQVPARLAERVALLRTLTHRSRMCVLLDNALSAAQVRVLAITAPGCATVVTTRDSISGLTMDGARFHQLDPWRAETGVAFIRRALGEDRVRDDPAAARRVAELCGGLPLALGVAAAKLASRPRWTLGRLAQALEQEGERLGLLDVDEASAVMPALDGSYQVLDEDLARLYRALGRCPVLWFEPVMVAAVIGSSVEQAEEQIDALVAANLLEALDERNDRHRFHDLVRLHAAHCADREPPREGDEAFDRLLDFFLAAATAAESILTPSHRVLDRDFRREPTRSPPFSGQAQALAWLDAQRPNLMAVLRYCARRAEHRFVWQLADAMWPLFLRLRCAEDRREAHGLAVAAARAEGDEQAEAYLLVSLAGSLTSGEQYDEAARCCERAVDLFERLEDPRGLAQAVNRRATIQVRLGDWDGAERSFRQALTLREREGYRRGVALAYQGLGKVAAARGDLALAAEHLRRSQSELEAEGDRYDAAWSQALRAQAVADLGETDRALRLIEEARDRMRASGSAFGQGGLLEIHARIQQAAGHEAEATELYRQAAELFARSDPVAAKRAAARLDGPPDAFPEPAAKKWQL